VAKDEVEAVKWYRKAAGQDYAMAQFNLGFCYANGQGVAKDEVEAVKWFRKAAEQNLPDAQYNLGVCYYSGQGLSTNLVEAAKWYRRAAEQGCADAQCNLAVCYAEGDGVPKDNVEARKWFSLAAAQGDVNAKKALSYFDEQMTQQQAAEAQRKAREFKPRSAPESRASIPDTATFRSRPVASGTGFFITEDGFLVTNEHVVRQAVQVRLVTDAGTIPARIVSIDTGNDLALLKADGRFAPLPVATSRKVRLGSTVATVGFPNIGLQGFAPKLTKGEISSLSGVQDNPRYFQISVPAQPGNSGGALVDERGNVVGVVSAKLNAGAALATSGALPENVNYAVKSSFLLSFLESVPDVANKLKAPVTADRKFEDVVKSAQDAAVLVLVY
jgi:S1-C subfamily serine protease